MAEKERVSVRVPKPLMNAIRKYVKADTHMNVSDFIRNALRNYIQEKAPKILQEEIDND